MDYHFFNIFISSSSIFLLSPQDAVLYLSLLCVLAVIANLVQSGVPCPLGVHPGIPEVCDTHVANPPITVPAVPGIAFVSRKLEYGVTTLTLLEVLFLCLSHGLAGQDWMRHAQSHPAPVPAHGLTSGGAGWKKYYTMQSAEHKHDDSLCHYIQGYAGFWFWQLLLFPKRSRHCHWACGCHLCICDSDVWAPVSRTFPNLNGRHE